MNLMTRIDRRGSPSALLLLLLVLLLLLLLRTLVKKQKQVRKYKTCQSFIESSVNIKVHPHPSTVEHSQGK